MTNPDHINQCKREPFIERVKEENGEGCNIDGFVEMSHKINKLSFGKEFPGVINPLYRLFLQSILISEAVKFTPTRNADAYLKLPAGVYFFYDFSPIKVIFTEENASLLHLLLLLEVFLLSPESLMLLSTMGMAQSRRRWNLGSTHDSTLD